MNQAEARLNEPEDRQDTQSEETERRIGQVQRLAPVIPALWEAKAVGPLEARSLRLAWTTWGHPVSTKIQENSQMWWCTPVIPELWEAEVDGLPEPRSWRSALATWQNPTSTKNINVVTGVCSPSYSGS